VTATHPAGDDLWVDMVRDQLLPELRQTHWATPGEMASALDRTTIQTPALDLIDKLLVQVAEGDCERAIISMPPQEGKSERVSRRFPLWLLHRNPNLRIAIVSFGHDVARRWGRKIRDDLRAHPELRLTLSQATQAQHEFELLGYDGGVVCVGVEGGLTSRPVDVLIIDDPYKDAKQADSEAWRETVRNFWTEVALPRLAPGAPVVLVQTRWRKDDLAGWLQAEGDDWTVLNIAAQADHDPAKGETDVLGREPGEFMESARRRTVADWLKKIREVGSRAWNALYQGRPSPVEGGILKREWWTAPGRQYDQALWVERDDGTRIVTGADELIASWDLTFKDTKGTDFVVGQVWMRRGADAYLLDQVKGRMDFVETCSKVREFSARWPQAVLKLVEDKANGPAVISSLRHTVPGIVPEEPQGSKTARAAAVSPLVEAGNVHLPTPEVAPWVGDLIEECAAFPNATHDDQVDALSQGLNRLLLQPLLGEGFGQVEQFEEFDMVDARGYYGSPV
jgi:predicted phage terminase large subunit-like protein